MKKGVLWTLVLTFVFTIVFCNTLSDNVSKESNMKNVEIAEKEVTPVSSTPSEISLEEQMLKEQLELKKEKEKDKEKQEKKVKKAKVSETEEVVIKNYNLTVDSDLRNPSNLSAEEIDKMLEGTQLCGLGNAFADAEKMHGVNSLYLIGLAALESDWGRSHYAVNRNNLYGWNANDSNPDMATDFDSQYDSTLYVASRLKENYLTEGGCYYHGYTPKAIDVEYCSDPEHANKIVSIVCGLKRK